MAVDFVGFVLSITGCPYLFSTGGLPALTSSSPLWFGGETDVVTLDGWLDWPTGWTERAKPLDGDLDTSAVTFRLHDATPTSGVSSGHPALTYLATRNARNVTSTPLAADITAAATSMTVSDGASLGTVPRWVWCEREALRVSSRAANVLTVARGALGTTAHAHEVDDAANRLPEVFADLPWITRRKVVLWGVDSAGAASVLWIGFAVRSPRLSTDGARFDLPCDPLWLVVSQAPVGDPEAVLRVSGYGRNGVTDTSTSNPTVARISVQLIGDWTTANANANGSYRDLPALATRLTREIEAQTLAVLGARIAYASVRFSAGSATVDLDNGTQFSASFHLFGQIVTAVSVARGARWSASLTLDGVTRSKYLVLNMGNGDFLLDSLVGAPSSWAAETTTASGNTTVRIPTLRAALSKDLWLVVSGVTATDTTVDGPKVSGSTEILPRKAGIEVPAIAWLTDCTGFNVARRVVTDHWLDGLRYGASDLLADASVNDFDWSTAAAVRRATTGLQTARDWLFDGRTTFGRVAVESCQLMGCTPVTRGGLLAFYAWGWPDARTTVTTTLASTDIIGNPSWLTWEEGLSNRIKVESDELVIDATDSGSINRYGPGRQIKIDLLGRDTTIFSVGDPIAFSLQVLGRMSLWADPLGIVRVRVPLRYVADLELGVQFRASDWVVPDGSGGRGMVSALGVVVARDVQIASGYIELDAILFNRTAYGYAPEGRVSSRSGTTIVILDQSFVQTAAGYSGGDDTTTFTAGDKVQLVIRDSTTLTTQDLTVLSVSAGAHSVTFTGAMNGTFTAAIDGGSWVDLRFSEFATPVQTSQEEWMFVGDNTTRVIDGTAELAREIAP